MHAAEEAFFRYMDKSPSKMAYIIGILRNIIMETVNSQLFIVESTLILLIAKIHSIFAAINIKLANCKKVQNCYYI